MNRRHEIATNKTQHVKNTLGGISDELEVGTGAYS